MLLLEVLFEVFGDLLVEILFDLGAGAAKDAAGVHDLAPVPAALGYLILGACLGATSAWAVPTRMLRPGPIPGISIIVTPLLVGGGMHLWGQWRRSRGHRASRLATLSGGAAFALGLAALRFLFLSPLGPTVESALVQILFP